MAVIFTGNEKHWIIEQAFRFLRSFALEPECAKAVLLHGNIDDTFRFTRDREQGIEKEFTRSPSEERATIETARAVIRKMQGKP